MPHVASESKSLALKSALAHVARPPQDRAASTPFESLLDDSAPPAPRPDNTARADAAPKTSRTKPAKSSDRADAGDDAKSDTKTDANQADDAGKTGKAKTRSGTHSHGKAGADAKATEQAIASDDTTATDPIDTQAADTVAAASLATAVEPLPQAAPIDALATAAMAGKDTPAQGAALIATAAKPGALFAAQEASKEASKDATKDGTISDPKDKLKGEPKLQAETAPQQPAEAKEAKTQAASNTADKDTIAQFRGEAPTAAHRGDAPAADTTASAPKLDAVTPQILPAPQQVQAASATTAAPAGQLPQTQPVPLAGVAIEIANKAIAGTNHFQIRLDPPELGRIEVRLHVDRDGNVTSRMIADRADTLDLLRRDASGLERALQDAGLKTADSGLQFSLRDQTTNQQQNNQGPATARIVVNDDMVPAADTTSQIYSRLAGQGSGIDIHV